MWQRRFRRKSIGAVPVSPTGWRDPTSPDYEPTAAFTMDRPPLSRTSARIILRYRRARAHARARLASKIIRTIAEGRAASRYKYKNYFSSIVYEINNFLASL